MLHWSLAGEPSPLLNMRATAISIHFSVIPKRCTTAILAAYEYAFLSLKFMLLSSDDG